MVVAFKDTRPGLDEGKKVESTTNITSEEVKEAIKTRTGSGRSLRRAPKSLIPLSGTNMDKANQQVLRVGQDTQ